MMRPLVAIVGPTAAGKSVLAVWVARQFDGEVLVCDSTQIYRGFQVGTAKLTPAQMQGVPHHLTDLVDPGEVFHAAAYRERALAVLEEVSRRGRLPVVVGGTGLYLRALLEGLCPAPPRQEALRQRLRERARQKGPAYLHRLLERLDPDSARRISPQDLPKTLRALEVALVSDRPLSELHRLGRPGLPGYAVCKVGLLPPRRSLYERINRRVVEMVQAGWVEELEGHLAKGLSPEAKPMQFIGYRQLYEYRQGRRSLDDAIGQIQQATRRYAKRQITWFRRDAQVRWYEGFGDDPQIQQAVGEHLREFLRSFERSTAPHPAEPDASSASRVAAGGSPEFAVTTAVVS